MLRNCLISFEYMTSSPKIICFENMIFSIENMSVSKKVNYLLRKYDFSFENMDVSKKVNPLL